MLARDFFLFSVSIRMCSKHILIHTNKQVYRFKYPDNAANIFFFGIIQLRWINLSKRRAEKLCFTILGHIFKITALS